ncbi:MAG: hypothetical protein K8F27_14405 [Sulfuricellaceae bacterium]|nr:hypothetical protein [Sulfuricellaceae bacterium]
MSKNIVLPTLAFSLAILIAVPLTACDADKLSEKEACKVATSSMQKVFFDQERSSFGRNYKVTSCSNFSSMSAGGVAQIDISFSYETHVYYSNNTEGYKPASGNNTIHLIRTDQGWKRR